MSKTLLVDWNANFFMDDERETQGDHNPLCFVTTCYNEVFNEGIFMHLSIFFSCPIFKYKATLTYFLAPYIYF
jgi:hypothetical protein